MVWVVVLRSPLSACSLTSILPCYMQCSGPNSKNGDLVLRVESGDPHVQRDHWGGLFYIGAGWDPYELIQRGGCDTQCSQQG